MGSLGTCLSFLLVVAAVPLLVSGAVNFQPEQLKSENGALDVTLTVSMEYTLNGTRYSPHYNGGPIGPTLRVKPGDRLTVTLVNDLPASPARDLELLAYVQDPSNEATPEGYVNMTIIYNRLSEEGNIYSPAYGFWGFNFQNVHFHGAGFSPKEEDLQHPIDGGGQSKTFTFTIPDDHPPGLVWYHGHVAGIGEYTMMSGTFGIMVIEGTPIDVTSIPEIGAATEMFMVMSEDLHDPESGVPNPFFPFFMAMDWNSVVNGILAEENMYEFTQGETVLFRTISASVEPTIRLYWQNETGPDFWLVAEDGFPVSSLEPSSVVEIPSGSRSEIVVKFDTPGTFQLRRQPWNLGITGMEICNATVGITAPKCVSYDHDRLIATVTVLPSDPPIESSLPTTVPEYSQVYKNMEEQDVVYTRTITFEQRTGFPLFQIPYDGPFIPPGTGFGVDGLLSTPHHRHGEVVAGTCEEWILISNPPMTEHSIHSHTVPFLVTHEDGVAVEEPFWRDTYAIMGHNATVKICFNRLEPGEWVFIHCHMVTHMDIGMAAYFDVIAPDGEPTTDIVPDENIEPDAEEESTDLDGDDQESSAWNLLSARTVAIAPILLVFVTIALFV